MRRRLATVVLTAVAALGAGCTDSPARDPGPAAGRASAAPGPTAPDPATATACRDATTVINDSTAAFTAAVDRALRAEERGDTAARDAAMTELRAAFRSWASRLRTVADTAGDPALQSTLSQYAGAVTATIARVRSAADLEKLHTFTEKELDIAASQFATVCG